MTIQELKELRELMERDIQNAIWSFGNATGIAKIEINVKVDIVQTYSGDRRMSDVKVNTVFGV